MYKKATNLTVKRCKFTISIGEAIINIRFCCTFFAEWKTINNKTMVSSPNRRKAVDCVVAFN